MTRVSTTPAVASARVTIEVLNAGRCVRLNTIHATSVTAKAPTPALESPKSVERRESRSDA